MRKILLPFCLFFAGVLAAPAQTLFRYSAPVISISSLTSTPYLVGNVPPSSPILAVCGSPANAVPCTNYATTYTSTGTPCANGAQDTPDPNPSSCQASGDAYGNIAFWAPVGTYTWTACIPNSTTCYGPYTVTLGGSGSPQGSATPAFLGNWVGSVYPFAPTTQGVWPSTTSANQVSCFLFQLNSAFTFNTLRIGFGPSNTATVGVGIYSAAGNRLIHWDSISAGNNSIVTATPTGGSSGLQPGQYFWCYAASIALGAQTVQTGSSLVDAYSSEAAAVWNSDTVRGGHAANAMSSGVLPTTLGTLTAGYANSNGNLPAWIVTPN